MNEVKLAKILINYDNKNCIICNTECEETSQAKIYCTPIELGNGRSVLLCHNCGNEAIMDDGCWDWKFQKKRNY